MQVEQTGTPAPTSVVEPAPSAAPPAEAQHASPIGPETASAAEPTKVETPVEAPAPEREPTLLEKFDADQAAKEAKPEGAEKPAETAKTEEKAAEAAKPEEKQPEAEKQAPEPFKFEELQVPEGFAKRFDIPEAEVGKRIEEFNDILLKDVDPNARRNELLGLHAKAMQEFADKVAADQRNAWNDYNKAQALATMGDVELGGAGHQTAMGAVARVRDALTRDYSKDEKQELNDFLVVTGAGSHRAFLRLVHRMARYLDEPSIPNVAPQPPPDRGQKPGRRASVLYDNQRSP